ncbi:fungal-specific transcription factor domain-domain-containing protein [Naematelia encephala]|uniref:Fungal-specific transcription factor domain-domain-containing protein n=1 Tax=Naematelia encephala TaxID=71784 RepID=A0A1Y2B8F8_9TREE|nr:fungal-specific transcription factor domain-domain-containing protein [Naematelia encephala]
MLDFDGASSSALQGTQKTVFACRTHWCGKEFPRRDYRDRHEAIHLGEKPYSCTECQRRYYRHDVLLRHQKQAHKTAETHGQKRRHLNETVETRVNASSGPSYSRTFEDSTSPQTSVAAEVPAHPTCVADEGGDDVSSLYKLSVPNPEEDAFYTTEREIRIYPQAGSHASAFFEEIITEEFAQFMATLVTNLEPSHFAKQFRSADYLATYLELYFTNFDPTLPILHRPSLTRYQDSDNHWILLAVILLGSTYSTQREAYQFASSTLYPLARSSFVPVLSSADDDIPLRLLQAAVLLDYFGAFWTAKAEHHRALVNHAMCIESIQLAGLWQPGLHSSTRLTWTDWLVYEERKRLASFVLVVDAQICVAFGEVVRIPFRQMRVCLPCKDEIWKAGTEEEWMRSAGPLIAEERSSTAYEHILSSDTMSQDTPSVFLASVLLAGAVASQPSAQLRLPEKRDPTTYRRMELSGVLLWSWHHAFLSSFSSSTIDRGNCEIQYHLSLIHNPNTHTQLLRMASGEPRVGNFVVKPWQMGHALEVLARAAPSPSGAFSAWHAVQIFNVIVHSVADERSHDPFTGWAVYIATLTIWHFGIAGSGKPVFGPLDLLCVRQTGPGPADIVIEPRLARKAALQYLEHYKPHQQTPGHYHMVESRNKLIGLLAYVIYFLQGLRWPIRRLSFTPKAI